EGHPDDASGTIGFAPALEHGNQSNGEQDDGADSENLDPHGGFLNAQHQTSGSRLAASVTWTQEPAAATACFPTRSQD
ncbi:MAG: hypothetical protein ACXVZT_13535, partial [Terriglobales bacterium]